MKEHVDRYPHPPYFPPPGPHREFQLHRHGELHQQEGRPVQRGPGLRQLPGPDRGDERGGCPGARGEARLLSPVHE